MIIDKLTKEEVESPLWKKLEAHFQERLNDARMNNDYDHEEKNTNHLRGRISAFKEILELNQED